MRTMPDASVDAVVTDPPYGLSFMGKDWDHGIPGEAFWAEALRVAKPGCHMLAFGGTRTFHRLTCAIEDAGWEVRDCLMWLYGSGFPKSHNGAWGGTALKPAWEPIILARKPLDGTVAANVQRHGCGGLNVDGCRIGTESTIRNQNDGPTWSGKFNGGERNNGSDSGRWPANLILDEEAGAGEEWSRFFYCPKASKADRDEGLEGMPERLAAAMHGNLVSGQRLGGDGSPIKTPLRSNHHPTVKPTALMRYLCRLVTPPGGLVLDPFTGSGSTGKAAALEGFNFIGIEREAEYVEIARARIAGATPREELFTGAA